MKKAGLIVAAAAAGLLMIGGPAFAGEPGNGGPGGPGGPGHHHGVEDHADKQVGLVNIQGVDIAKDLNVNVNAGVCGVQGLSAPVASAIPFDKCVTDSGIFDD